MKIKPKKQKLLEADLTPMIDMTFQLIAFFMVLVNFTEVDQNALIMLPASELAKPPEEGRRYNLTLNLTERTELPGSTEPAAKVILAGQEMGIVQLGPQLEYERNTALSQKFTIDEINVIIRADKDAQAQDLQDLIKKCQDNQLITFSLRVKEDIN
jgi:biopolymer transport protein ExbD